VRFHFRGFRRETGEPVHGGVEAPETEAAFQVLSDHGIVTEMLQPEPEPTAAAAARIEDALDSALDASSSQVAFDALAERYRGKKVWVIDREKIRQHVAQVVDSTLAASEAGLESGATTRERVADAIKGLFHDPQNVASQLDPQSVAMMRAIVAAAAGAAQGAGGAAGSGMSNAELAAQIGRLTGVVQQAEGLIAAMSSALRNLESGAAVPRRRLITDSAPPDRSQNEVLREIFQSNLDLRRSAKKASSPPDTKAA
jgi:hypothetical protein